MIIKICYNMGYYILLLLYIMNNEQHTGASLGPTAGGIPIAGRYSFEQRKERINRYRSKKTQRNFSRTIKVLLI